MERIAAFGNDCARVIDVTHDAVAVLPEGPNAAGLAVAAPRGPVANGLSTCSRTRGMKYRELVALIEDDGWRLVRRRGSHRQYRHETKPGLVTIAGQPAKDVPKGTAANILRQAGLQRPKR